MAVIRTLLTLLLLWQPTLAASCTTNDCFRQVLSASQTARQDCSTFRVVTASPTIYTTVTATVTMSNGPNRPAYASSCRSWAAFDSACACFGVRQSTVTASAVRITRTLTVTTTAKSPTSSSGATSPPTFALEIHTLGNQRSSVDPYIGVDSSTNSLLYLGPKPHNASSDALAFSLANSTSGPWSIRSKYPGSFAGADFTASNRSFVAIGNTEFYPNTQLQCKIDGNKAFTCLYKNGLVGNWFLCSRKENGNTKYSLVISTLTDSKSFGCPSVSAVGLTAVAVPAGS